MVNCTLTCGKVTCILDLPSVTAQSSNVDFDNCLTPMEICLFFLLVKKMGIPFKGSIWLEPGHRWLWPHHHWTLFRNHLSLREYSNQGFEAAHSLQHQLYIFKGYFPWQTWSCYIKLVLYFTFLVLYFFILSYILTLQYFKLILSPT